MIPSNPIHPHRGEPIISRRGDIFIAAECPRTSRLSRVEVLGVEPRSEITYYHFTDITLG